MTLVMGIVNVTPDSFSDGGRYLDAEAAIAHGRALRAAGADLLDVGGESTRPGAQRVDPALEQERVLPVVASATSLPLRMLKNSMVRPVSTAATTQSSVSHFAESGW